MTDTPEPTPTTQEHVAAQAGEDSGGALRAALWMLGAVGSFSAMAVAGRTVSAELDTFEIMTYRSALGLLAVLAIGWPTGGLARISCRRLDLHLGRNLCHFAGQNLWFFALTLIPLAQVFALEFTSPLWVLILSPIFLRERLTRLRVVAALTGFAGILIVTRPSPDSLNAGTIAAAAAAVGFAGAILFTKRLTRSETLITILFWMTLMQTGFGLICAGFDGDIALPSAAVLPWLGLIAAGGLAAHFCLTTALSLAPATLIMPVDFLRLPLIAVVGLLVYGEAIDAFVIVGAALIFGANYANIWAETRNRPRARPAL